MLPLLALRTGAGEEEDLGKGEDLVFLNKGLLKSVANEASKNAKEIEPNVPLDMEIDPVVLEETIYAMDLILGDGKITTEELILLLVKIRQNTTKLWIAVVECYRKNQELKQDAKARTAQENEPDNKKESGPRSATPDAYTTNVERVRTPKSMQKIMTLIAALMAVLSIAGPELITAADNARPMENEDGGGVVFNFTDPSLPPRPASLPTLPPPPERGGVMRSKSNDASYRPGARDARPAIKRQTSPTPRSPALPAPPTPRSPALPAPPTPQSPAESDPPLPLDEYEDEWLMEDPDDGDSTTVDPGWWQKYLKKALLTGGVGMMGMAKQSARR